MAQEEELFDKNFGVDASARRYLNPMTGKWVTDPIVWPYIKFNNGQKLGFDYRLPWRGLALHPRPRQRPCRLHRPHIGRECLVCRAMTT
jgi:hypothetical protein